MILQGAFFYLFATVAIAAAFMVISARNPVHAVLFLILTFFNVAGLFILMGAEYLAMLLVVVYVGAVMVLFLFVVMMLDVDYAELRQGFLQYLPAGVIIGLMLLTELVLVVGAWIVTPELVGTGASPAPKGEAAISNIEALGRIIYTDYVFYFEVSGLILLVAMIGAIVLTLHHRTNVKRQNIADQVARRPEEAIEIVKVESGKGI